LNAWFIYLSIAPGSTLNSILSMHTIIIMSGNHPYIYTCHYIVLCSLLIRINNITLNPWELPDWYETHFVPRIFISKILETPVIFRGNKTHPGILLTSVNI
jgi:hypothetical protein